jgi:transcriptional regulator with XRE-family HTH domain
MSAVSTRHRARPAARDPQERAAATRPSPAPHLALVGGRPSESLDPQRDPGERRAPQQLFCARLKATRERRGITLAALAQSTKVSASHFAALERGDLSHWPAGVYKRAFFRAYAAGIGLSPAPALEEFLRLFPDEDGVPLERPPIAEARDPDAFRLMLAREPASIARAFTFRAAVEVVAGLLFAFVLWWADVSAWTAVGLLALGWRSPLIRLARGVQLRMRR